MLIYFAWIQRLRSHDKLILHFSIDSCCQDLKMVEYIGSDRLRSRHAELLSQNSLANLDKRSDSDSAIIWQSQSPPWSQSTAFTK